MAEERTPHVDVAAYLLGTLDAEERASFERHLAGCAECREQRAELQVAAGLAGRAAPPVDLPPGLQARTVLAVERAAAEAGGRGARSTPPRRYWLRRVSLAAAAVAAVAVGVLGGFLLGRAGQPGSFEFRAVMTSPDGRAEATARVTKTGIGRVIVFKTDELPILPTGEYYELWFVGPGDSPGRPSRISAGTFHPDEDGRSHVRFAAAVDPKEYPGLSVTAEPGDGNPQRTGPEVLRFAPR